MPVKRFQDTNTQTMKQDPLIDLDAYFSRIGYTGDRLPTLATLDAIIARHVTGIPFENLDVLMGKPILLDPASLQQKLVASRRGGYCFEQNGLLLLVLEQLGYQVTPHSARVRWLRPRDFTPPRTHLFLRIGIDGRFHIADVGVGGISPTKSLPLTEDTPERNAHDSRRLIREGGLLVHQVSFGGDWTDVYEFTLEEMPPIDRELANWFTSTHPQSHFKNNLIAARATSDGGRLSLLNFEFTTRRNDGTSDVRVLASESERLDVLARHFALRLPPDTRFPAAGSAATAINPPPRLGAFKNRFSRLVFPRSMTKRLFILGFLTSFCLWAQDAAVPESPAAAPVEDSESADDGVRVSVLGYHEFTPDQPETEMRISTSKFRRQMEALRQLGISVISMDDFIAWKKGEKKIPEKSVLLTLDDGWKSVYTDAFPILREFNYPFTIYLYKNYVDGGGKALTIPMIKEMAAAGATIGSHSVSHPYPITFKSHQKKGPDAYDAFLRKEMGESKRFLESKFAMKAHTYSYPGGYFTDEMLPIAKEFGYTHLFTVRPGQVEKSTPNELIPRYMILGSYDKIFEFATAFPDAKDQSAPAAGVIASMVKSTPHPVYPPPGIIINSRLPEISADLSKVDNIDSATLVMKVSGYGEVPASYDAETKKFSWIINRKLRQSVCKVSVSWQDADGKSPETPLDWSFQIDRDSAYIPDSE